MTELLKQAFDAEKFRENGHFLVDLLADYMKETAAGNSNRPVLPYNAPDKVYADWQAFYSDGISSDIKLFYKKILDDSIHLHNPKYMGHQVPPALPTAALTEFMSAFMNNATGVYEMGSAGIAIERLVISVLSDALGFDKNAEGVLTSGGTLGNLTALLAARRSKVPYDAWTEGHKNGYRPVVLVSEEAHYSIDRAVKVMGWGDDGIEKIPTGSDYKLDLNELKKTYTKSIEAGKHVIAVVGNACSTSLGLYDPLEAVADFCEEHDLWFHVDAAHGGPAAFSKKYNHLIKGMERADSAIVDFHKLLMIPSLVTAVVFKEGGKSYDTFSQKAAYLWESRESGDWSNLGKRTFECTKNLMSLKVFSIINSYGTEIFGETVTAVYNLGKVFAELISARSGFELAAEPESNIICFRFNPNRTTATEADELNRAIRKSMIEKGKFFIVQTLIRNKVYLRTSLMNPYTSAEDLNLLLDEIEITAGKIK